MAFGSRQTATWLSALAGLCVCACGCLAGGGKPRSLADMSSGPSRADTSSSPSLAESSSSRRRPPVTATYPTEPADDVTSQAAAVEATAQAAATTQAASNAESPTITAGRTPVVVPQHPAAPPIATDDLDRALANLPPEEQAVLRRMLTLMRQGPNAASATAPGGNVVVTGAPVTPVPADGAPVAGAPITLAAADRPLAENLAANVASAAEIPSPFVTSRRPERAVASPFVTDSLHAFTAGAPQAPASPIAQALAVGMPIATTAKPGVAEVLLAGHLASVTAAESSSASYVSAASVPADSSNASGNAPIAPATEATPDWKDELAEASRALEVAIAKPALSEAERRPLEAKLRLLRTLEHRFTEALDPVNDTPERQAFWTELCGALQEMFDPQATPYDDKRATLALRRMEEAVRQLARSADLDVSRLAFCTSVEAFGQYSEFTNYRFEPDQETLLYVEVRNFAAEAVQKPHPGYRTLLEGSYRIIDVSTGRRWTEHSFPPAEEVSRSPRKDFFIAYRVYLPKTIPPGKYRLEFNLRDEIASKHGMSRLDFEVVAAK